MIWDHLLERTTRGNSEVNPLPTKPPNCRAAIFVFLIHQWLSVYKLAPGPLVLEKEPWIYRKIPKITPRAFIFERFPSTRKTYKPPWGLHLEGRLNGGFSGLRVWGAYIWRTLYMEGLIFGILRYLFSCAKIVQLNPNNHQMLKHETETEGLRFPRVYFFSPSPMLRFTYV